MKTPGMRLPIWGTVVMMLLVSGIARAVDPPRLTKSFLLPPERSFVNPGETASVVFTITNPNAATGLTGIAFTDDLPPGLIIATPSGLTSTCGGAATAPPGGSTIALTGGTLGIAGSAAGSCAVSVYTTALTLGMKTNTTSPIASIEGGTGAAAIASLLVANTLLVRYAANLNVGVGSVVNLANVGTQNIAGALTDICANVYVFSPDEQLIACCACPLAADDSGVPVEDLISNTLTPAKPASVVLKLVATSGSTCNAGTVTQSNLATGLVAWGTTLHALPTAPVTYGITETPFADAALSPAELSRITSTCAFIQANGSGFGICPRCRVGTLGSVKR